MKYTYFPGCSLKGTGKSYEESLLPVFEALGIEIQELDDWNCCGATAYMAVDESSAFSLAARNLALAEKTEDDLLAPCSGCYLVLQKAGKYCKEYPKVGKEVGESLKKAGLDYSGKTKVRHPLDVLTNDIGLEAVKNKVKKPLKGLKIAPYYGCQIVRPYSTFDHQAYPTTMDRLLETLGATVIDYPLKTKCCGGSLTGTLPEAGLGLSYMLLKEARKRGADMVAVLCPLCQFNLDAFQGNIKKQYENVSIPVVYFTQLMGLAFGIPRTRLGLSRHIVPVKEALV